MFEQDLRSRSSFIVLQLPPAPAWMDRNDLPCRGRTALFFGDKWEQAAAKRLCRQCEFIEPCADWAELTPPLWGVWGGLSRDDRDERRAARTTNTP